jgi:hypothetical protein
MSHPLDSRPCHQELRKISPSARCLGTFPGRIQGSIIPKRPFSYIGGHVQPVSLCCHFPEVSRFVAISPIRFHPMN